MLREIVACVVRNDDLRTPSAHAAFGRVVEQRGVVISVGGGPRRVHRSLTNVNIVIERGVDVGGNAYGLPFRSGAVGGVHCEAVLEHLEFPEIAVAEMLRVLRPDGLLFAATPFLQPYHGYPDHFQNYTLNGHVRLFERAGFVVEQAGTCVGPTFAVFDLLANYARELLPGRLMSRGAERVVRSAGRLLRLADLKARGSVAASNLCSSSFVLARNPGRPRRLNEPPFRAVPVNGP